MISFEGAEKKRKIYLNLKKVDPAIILFRETKMDKMTNGLIRSLFRRKNIGWTHVPLIGASRHVDNLGQVENKVHIKCTEELKGVSFFTIRSKFLEDMGILK